MTLNHGRTLRMTTKRKIATKIASGACTCRRLLKTTSLFRWYVRKLNKPYHFKFRSLSNQRILIFPSEQIRLYLHASREWGSGQKCVAYKAKPNFISCTFRTFKLCLHPALRSGRGGGERNRRWPRGHGSTTWRKNLCQASLCLLRADVWLLPIGKMNHLLGCDCLPNRSTLSPAVLTELTTITLSLKSFQMYVGFI